MALREIESTLPPGFRFYPSDEELVCHYLRKKVANERIAQGTLVEVDLHAREPWELPEVAKLTANEWYFFSFRDRKYATGLRTNRATKTGYWKATGKDREVRSTRAVVGMRKTLVFYQGRAPNGVKSGWVMHEFRLDTPHAPPREDWVLCRVFQKRKVDGDGQDNAGASSPAFAGSSHAMPDQPAMTTTGGYYDMHTGSSTGFAPHQDQAERRASAVLTNAALPHYYSGGPVLDHHHGFPQEMGSVQPVFVYGFNSYFDMGFEDMANLGGMRYPQGWDD